jgi:hypothetical protein
MDHRRRPIRIQNGDTAAVGSTSAPPAISVPAKERSASFIATRAGNSVKARLRCRAESSRLLCRQVALLATASGAQACNLDDVPPGSFGVLNAALHVAAHEAEFRRWATVALPGGSRNCQTSTLPSRQSRGSWLPAFQGRVSRVGLKLAGPMARRSAAILNGALTAP